MTVTVQRSIESAINAIDAFLEASASDPEFAGGPQIRRLASRIQAVQMARRGSDRVMSDPHLVGLQTRYREGLEKLRLRLDEIQRTLLADRERLLRQQAQLARTREWHQSLNTTQ